MARDSTVTLPAVVGTFFGVITVASIVGYRIYRRRAAAKAQEEHANQPTAAEIQLRSISARDLERLDTYTRNSRNTQENHDIPPAYEQHTASPLVNESTVRRPPSPLVVAQPLSAEQRPAVLDDQGRLTIYERTRRAQSKLDELKALTSAAPPEGYAHGSVEDNKVHSLRDGISRLMESPRIPTTPVPLSLDVSAGESSSGAPSPHPSPNAYERALAIQRLLARIEELTLPAASSSRSAEEQQEVHEKIKDLKRCIAEITGPLPTISGQPLSESDLRGGTVTVEAESRGAGERGDEQGRNATRTAGVGGVVPPPYEAIRGASDGRQGALIGAAG